MNRRTITAAVGVAAAMVVLILLAIGSAPFSLSIAQPDIDGMLKAVARQAPEAGNIARRTEISELRGAGGERLRQIARDRTRHTPERVEAIRLLRAQPEALFDILALIEDPDTEVRRSAVEAAELCLSEPRRKRNPKTEEQARLLKKWYAEHANRGFAAIGEGRDILRSPDTRTASTAAAIFEEWRSHSAISARSPYLDDLRAIGRPATLELLGFADSDSAPIRARAFLILGLLGDSFAVAPLEAALAAPRHPTDRPVIEMALKQLRR